MSLRIKSYSDFVNRACGLIGVPYANMMDTEKEFLNGYFNTAMRDGWESNSWIDLCPYGEARFVGNILEYANNYTNPLSGWSAPLATLTDNVIANPLDGRMTAGSLTETGSSSNQWLMFQTGTTNLVLPSTNYQYSVFVRPKGRYYCELLTLEVPSGDTYYAYFSLSGVGSVVSQTNCTAAVTQVANGFYLCSINFTTSSTATYVSPFLYPSNDGTTNVYTGTLGNGLYVYGMWLGPVQAPPNNMLIPYEQTGERVIESVIQVWSNNPSYTSYPRPQGYELTRDGIIIVGNSAATYGYSYGFGVAYVNPLSNVAIIQNAVYLYYRLPCPNYTGSDYSDNSTYVADDQILFEDSDGVLNYYKCLATTSLTQSPETTPSKWELLEIPIILFEYAVYSAYADWLRMDGQLEKAAAMSARAENFKDSEADKQERQQGWLPPLKVQTHVTSQSRF